ncbi:MAG: hydrogenase maturation protease [Candidatus Omnitrophota bacterium]
MKKTLVIGIGSILRGDDGLGMRVIDEIEKEICLKNITLESADVSGLDLLKYFPGNDKIIIVDAADMREEPGKIKIFKADEIKKNFFNELASTHGMPLTETLALAEKVGITAEIIIVAIQPEDISFKLELSEKIKKTIPFVVDKIKEIISSESKI